MGMKFLRMKLDAEGMETVVAACEMGD